MKSRVAIVVVVGKLPQRPVAGATFSIEWPSIPRRCLAHWQTRLPIYTKLPKIAQLPWRPATAGPIITVFVHFRLAGHGTNRMKTSISVRKLARPKARPTFRPCLECLESRLALSAYTVSNLADAGPGSLRAAITSVNGDSTADVIDFSVSGIIKLTSGPLPAITNTVKIDGTTAPGGYGQDAVVEIDNNGFAGLTIAAPNSTLTTQSIVNANGPGVTLEGDNITVVGNLIGIAPDGSVAANTGVGLFIDNSTGDKIGAVGVNGNTISGNGGGGIQLGTSGAPQFVQSATILGNYIGTQYGGGIALPNQGNGITVFSTGNTIGGTAYGAPNTIANNTGSGVVVNAGTQDAIQGNSIFNNTGPGIQLLNNGNHDQPAPVLTGSYLASQGRYGANLALSGTLTATPNTQYLLNFFALPTTAQAVQGDAYVGSQTVTTDADGVAIFASNAGGGSTEVSFRATATNSSTNDTSAYSNSIDFNTTQPAFVADAYPLLLNRDMDGSAYSWVNGLSSGAFTPLTMALAMVGSPEYITDQVGAMYLRYLRRDVDAQAEQYWFGFIQAGGTLEAVAEALTSSQEYFVLKGGTNQGFITGLYHDVLNRSASDAEIAYWEAALSAGASRVSVSTAFLTSQEYRTNLVQADYTTFLKRPADNAGLAAWLTALNSGATDQEVLARIFGSPEGYQVWS